MFLSICCESFENISKKSIAFGDLQNILIAIGLTFGMRILKKETCLIEFEKTFLTLKHRSFLI